MPITNQELWEDQVKKNDDPYGGACINVAREVMVLLDAEPGEIDTYDIICRADRNANAGGITGFMAGCVANMVSQCHSRGDEFKRQWNKSCGAEDSNGVVNPAVLTLAIPKEGE